MGLFAPSPRASGITLGSEDSCTRGSASVGGPTPVQHAVERGHRMKLSLLVMTPGKQEGKALEIKLSQFVVGRDPQCHLRPASPLISKRHCAIIQRDGK